MSLSSVKICSAGLKRSVNQDRAVNLVRDECGLFLVADGMGGHYAGEKASQALANIYTEWWMQTSSSIASTDFETVTGQLKSVLAMCNRTIFESTPRGKICGSTLVLLLIVKDRFQLLTVGDSRCYQVTPSFIPHIRQISLDDISTESGSVGKLTEAVGCRSVCRPLLQTGRCLPKTIFALCSDGVYKYCPPTVWKINLVGAALGGSLQKTAERISNGVQDNGAHDNYSLVLVRT